MDNESQDDVGVAVAIMQRMETQHLPRALELKEKVDGGERLDALDISFLERVFADSNDNRPLLAKHPEYQDLAARMLHIYHQITAKALENEKAA
jgi:hypothetical protein